MIETNGGDRMSNEVKHVSPKELALALDVDPKRLRAFLRSNFTRPNEAKNTSWSIGPEAVAAATEHFAKSETP
jgi:hypothetical protein